MRICIICVCRYIRCRIIVHETYCMYVHVYIHTYTLLLVKLYKEMHCMYVHVHVHTYAVFPVQHLRYIDVLYICVHIILCTFIHIYEYMESMPYVYVSSYLIRMHVVHLYWIVSLYWCKKLKIMSSQIFPLFPHVTSSCIKSWDIYLCYEIMVLIRYQVFFFNVGNH